MVSAVMARTKITAVTAGVGGIVSTDEFNIIALNVEETVYVAMVTGVISAKSVVVVVFVYMAVGGIDAKRAAAAHKFAPIIVRNIIVDNVRLMA